MELIEDIRDLTEVIGEEKFNELLSSFEGKYGEIKYSKASYDDTVDVGLIREIFEDYKEAKRSGSKAAWEDFYEEAIYSHFYDYIWDYRYSEMSYYIENHLMHDIKKALPEGVDISPDIQDELYDKLSDRGNFYVLESSFAKETFPTLKVNVMLATERELDLDLGSIGDMNYLAFGETQEGFRVTSFAEADREDCLEACDNMLTNIIYQQGKSLADIYYPKETEDTFINSVRQEILNKPYHRGCVTFLSEVGYDELSLLAEGKDIKVDKNVMIGLFEEWLGTGSLLDISLDKDLLISGNDIFKVQFEDGWHKRNAPYTVDSVYGLVGSCWKPSIESMGDGEKPYEIEKERLEKDIISLKNFVTNINTLDSISYNALNNKPKGKGM